MNFSDYTLKKPLLDALTKMKYVTPTPIQAEVLDHALDGKKNIVGQSDTGTGKTTAFLLPILNQVDPRSRKPQALILAPTRELVNQIRDEVYTLTSVLMVRSLAIYGGSSMRTQIDLLKKGPQIIIATPGRLMDLMEKRLIDLKGIEFFVLDEVDRMLDMGFVEDIEYIWDQLPPLKQTFTFSATINPQIEGIIKRRLTDYSFIKTKQEVTTKNIDHTYVEVHRMDKFSTLKHFLDTHKGQKIVIFTETKKNTEIITKTLKEGKFNVEYLHGDLRQSQRTRVLKDFKDKKLTILVTTDVAARGLNLNDIHLVINFDIPKETESYIHRIGRTGRAGASGKAVMFVEPNESHLVKRIEREQKVTIKRNEQSAITDTEGKYATVIPHVPKQMQKKTRSEGSRSRSSRSFSGERKSYGGGERRFSRDEKSFDRKKTFGERTERGPRKFGEHKDFSGDRTEHTPRKFGERREGSPSEGSRAPRKFGSDRTPGRSFGDRSPRKFSDRGPKKFGSDRGPARGKSPTFDPHVDFWTRKK